LRGVCRRAQRFARRTPSLGVVSRLRRTKSKAPALQKKELHTFRFGEERRKFPGKDFFDSLNKAA
jgi:hypothetical protein